MENKRNCNTCKFGMFARCEELKNNEEYQNKKSSGQYEFKENFICENYKSIYIEYPIEVSKINNNCKLSSYKHDVGKFVSIRPCNEKYENKTYLGLYLGELPLSSHISHNSETKELSVSFHNNPAIFVFDLNEIIFGCSSWWSIIENESELKEISDIDIDNVWYVKVLKQLSEKE